MHSNAGVNKVLLMGQVDSTSILQKTENSQLYTCITLLTKETISKGSDKIEHYEYHKLNIPQKLLQQQSLNLQPGQMLYVEGKVQTKTFTDEQQIRRYNSEIMASKIELLHTYAAAG